MSPPALRYAVVFLLSVLALAVYPADRAEANPKYASLIMDETTGEVLFSRNADARRYPASLTKVMTLYVLFEELDAGRLKLDSKLTASRRAAAQPPSKIGIKSGEKISVKDAIGALIVRSGNDVAVVVAEAIEGTERQFARRMTERATSLGMKNTKFRNASGLPNRAQVTTARDMAMMGQAMRKNFPQYWHFFQTKSFKWKGRTWRTHNNVLKNNSWADGMKTGYTNASGFNLLTSADRSGVRLLGVVMGGRTAKRRDREMVRIMDLTYGRIAKNPRYKEKVLAALPRPIPRPMAPSLLKPNDDMRYPSVLMAKAPAPKADTLTAPMPRPAPTAVTATVVAAVTTGEVTDIDAPVPTLPSTMKQTLDEDLDMVMPTILTRAEPVAPEPSQADSANPAAASAPGITLVAALDHEPESALPDGLSDPETAVSGGPTDEELTQYASAAASLPRPSLTQVQRARPGGTVFGSSATKTTAGRDPIAALIAQSDGPPANGAGKSVKVALGPVANDLDQPEGFGQGDGQPLRAIPASAELSATNVGIQIGAFLRMSTATQFIRDAIVLAPEVLDRNKAAILTNDNGDAQVFRARFGPLTEDEANTACGLLEARGMDCFSISAVEWASAIRLSQ